MQVKTKTVKDIKHGDEFLIDATNSHNYAMTVVAFGDAVLAETGLIIVYYDEGERSFVASPDYPVEVIVPTKSVNVEVVEFDPCLFNLYIEGINAKEPTASYCEVCTERFSQCRCFETKEPVKISDNGVKSPSHYMLFDDIEAIEVIARSMTVEQFKGYCLGNILKYRLRAGKKSELATLEKDLAKADFYKELFDKHKSKCYDYSSIGVKNCVVNL